MPLINFITGKPVTPAKPLTFTRKAPTYGDMFTIEEFREMVAEHLFVDSDGHGCPSDGKMLAERVAGSGFDYVIYPSGCRDLPPEITHVVWFNK